MMAHYNTKIKETIYWQRKQCERKGYANIEFYEYGLPIFPHTIFLFFISRPTGWSLHIQAFEILGSQNSTVDGFVRVWS